MGKCKGKGKKKVIAALAALLFVLPAIAMAGSARLSWQDNSNNEAVFNIERKNAVCASPLPWAEISTVTANVVSFTDVGLAEGAVVCYRVAASNSAGKSAYTNEVAFTVPFTIPVAPSLLGVTILP
jgi:titin